VREKKKIMYYIALCVYNIMFCAVDEITVIEMELEEGQMIFLLKAMSNFTNKVTFSRSLQMIKHLR
jgi:hypothetical protein